MDYTKLSLFNCQDLACSEFGLENPHTIAIARLVDLVADDLLAKDEATEMARIIYDHGANELIYPFEDEEDEDAYFDEADESGFDPYMGCYTGDC